MDSPAPGLLTCTPPSCHRFANRTPTGCHDGWVPQPLFSPHLLDRLRESLTGHFSPAEVSRVLGLQGDAALSRFDLNGVDRLTRGGSATELLIRLFVLGLAEDAAALDSTLDCKLVDLALAEGLLVQVPDGVRSSLGIRPIERAASPAWLVADFGPDVRPGVLDAEHVLGPGRAATTLADATIRGRVASALDVGTGCGVQALYLADHVESVTATDLSARALRMAATTASLSGLHWQLIEGSLLEPVADRTFDLVVCNPPFVVGPGFAVGASGFRYRDSGLAGDTVSRTLVNGLPSHLTDGGTAQLLANWVVTADEGWDERLAGWLAGSDCDAWVWQREVADPGEYVSLWLRDGGLTPGTPEWTRRYDEWLDWFEASGVLAIGMGLVNLRRTGRPAGSANVVVCEDVRQPVEPPSGAEIAAWFDRASWLVGRDDAAIRAAAFAAAKDLVLTTSAVLEPTEGWRPALVQLRQSHGMRWELEVDEAVAALVAASAGAVPWGVLVELIAGATGLQPHAANEALAPVVRDLVQRGFLLPGASA